MKVPLTLPRIAICGLGALTALVPLSPQIGVIGRGARTELPAFIMISLIAWLYEPIAASRALDRAKPILLIGGLFIFQAGLRFIWSDDPDAHIMIEWYVISPIEYLAICLIAFLLSEIGDEICSAFRSIILVFWCGSLALGIPYLLSNENAARKAMAIHSTQGVDLISIREFELQGAATVGIYTGFALVFPFLSNIVNGWRLKYKWLGYSLLFGGAVSVLLSTLVFPIIVLIINSIYWFCFGPNIKTRWFVLAGVFVVTAASWSMFKDVSENNGNIDYVVQKVLRLTGGMTKEGLEGDETGRGSRIEDGLQSLGDGNWLYGYIPGVTNMVVGGHCAAVDSLVLFGGVGTSLWLFVMYSLCRDGIRCVDLYLRTTNLVCWGLLLISGFANPTWHSFTYGGTLAIFCIYQRKD